MKIYIAGPMRGYKDFNFPAFDAAKKLGESLGHEVTSPADMDREHDGFEGIGKDGVSGDFIGSTLERCVRRDCEAVINNDAIALLPGWENSTGAKAEHAIAMWLGRTILSAETFEPYSRVPFEIWREREMAHHRPSMSVNLEPPVTRGEIKNGDFVVKDSGQRTVFATGAQRDLQTGKGYYHLIPFIAIERLAKLYEAGAEKYGPNNWQKGIPIFAYVNSAIRHVFKLKEGWTDEDHAAAALWNVAGYMWTLNEINEGRLSKGLLELTNKLVEDFIQNEKA